MRELRLLGLVALATITPMGGCGSSGSSTSTDGGHHPSSDTGISDSASPRDRSVRDTGQAPVDAGSTDTGTNARSPRDAPSDTHHSSDAQGGDSGRDAEPSDGAHDAAPLPDSGHDAAASPFLDPTFGGGAGYVTTALNAGTPDSNDPLALAIDAQGRIVVAGTSENLNETNAGAWRFDANGAADTTFASNGAWFVFGTNNGGYDGVNGLCVDGQGNVLMTGQSNNNSPYYMALWRLTGSGALDSTFAGGGYVSATSTAPTGGAYDVGYGVACSAAGPVVTGTSLGSGHQEFMATWRYTETGALDTAGFNTPAGAVVKANTAGGSSTSRDEGSGVRVDGSGRIVVAGGSEDATDGEQVVVWRYLSNGAPDTAGFGGSGHVVVPGPAAVPSAGGGGPAFDSNGNILVFGDGELGEVSNAFVARITSAGTVDSTFGSSGYALVSDPHGSELVDITAIAVDSMNRIVLAGLVGGFSGGIVWRLTPSGTLDTTFGDNGVVALPGSANALAVDAADRPVVTGNEATGGALIVWRLHS